MIRVGAIPRTAIFARGWVYMDVSGDVPPCVDGIQAVLITRLMRKN